MSRPRLQEFFAEETQESKSEVKGKTQKKKKRDGLYKSAHAALPFNNTHKKKEH